MNKRGDFTGVLYLIVSIAAFAIFLLIAGYIASEIAGELDEKIDSDRPEVSAAFDATIDTAEQTFSALWYIMFGGLLLGLLITSWNMRIQPIYVPIFIILLVVTVIVGVAFSNAYEQLYGVTYFDSIANTQGSINFMMGKLPYVA
ncbi:unnamed protein product, partial [marine sediment metagenome]